MVSRHRLPSRPGPTYDPFREVSALNAFKQILTVGVGVHCCRGLRLFPQKCSLALEGPEPKLDKLGLSIILHKAEGMDTPVAMSQ